MFSSRNVRNQVSYPQQTKGKITLLCILIFVLSDSKLEEQMIAESHKELADAKLLLCPASGPVRSHVSVQLSAHRPTDRPTAQHSMSEGKTNLQVHRHPSSKSTDKPLLTFTTQVSVFHDYCKSHYVVVSYNTVQSGS
jgi:hypothetical protein